MSGRRFVLAALVCSLPIAASTFPPTGRALPRATLTFTVNTTADEHASAPNSGKCADAGGRCSLRAAIEVADATSAPTVVKLPAGTYRLKLGELVVTDRSGITIAGANEPRTVVNAVGESPPARVLAVEGTGKGSKGAGGVLYLQKLTITGGDATAGAAGFPGDGGGIAIEHPAAAAVLTSVDVARNRSAASGGGIFDAGDLWLVGSTVATNDASSKIATEPATGGGLEISNGSAVLAATTVKGNTASGDGASGGGIDDASGPLSVAGGSVTDNTAASTALSPVTLAEGGGIRASDTALLSGTTVSGNKADPTGAHAGGVRARGGGLALLAGGTLSGVKLNGNDAVSSTGEASLGGGVLASDALSISGSRLTGNEAAPGYGGAVYANSLTMSHSVVQANAAQAGAGGGIYAATAVVSASTIAKNVVRTGNGGGIFATGGNIDGSTINANNALGGNGGGVYGNGGTVSFSDDTVSGNLAAGTISFGNGLGGGIDAVGPATIQSSSITGNRAQVGGGGFVDNAGMTADAVTVSGNGAPFGAGVYADWVLQLTDSTIAANSGGATGTFGGGVYVAGGSGSAAVHRAAFVFDTVASNSASAGGGIYEAGGASYAAGAALVGTIVAGNKVTGGKEGDCAVGNAGPFNPNGPPPLPLTSLGHNLIGDHTCALHGTGDQLGRNPLLGPLAANGGREKTMALRPGSPAIGAGGTLLCPTTDERGVARPAHSSCDAGAFQRATSR